MTASAAVGTLPPLSPKQELKMKQLTVVSLAETAKVCNEILQRSVNLALVSAIQVMDRT